MRPYLPTILGGWFALKFLCSFCYVSTDFEVHRNWLAITYNSPIHKWYLENTSIWTLDYPPFFAWFECGLAHVGALFLLNDSAPTAARDSALGIRDDEFRATAGVMLDVSTVLFQRITVIVADLWFVLASFHCVKFIFSNERGTNALPSSRRELGEYVLTLLLCCNVGLFFVDNIHFQYNGFLFGFLLLSITYVGQQRYLLAALLFAVLLNLKHIFLYLAPAFAAFFFRNYCFPVVGSEQKNEKRGNLFQDVRLFSFLNFCKLLLIGGFVFSVSFTPFLYYGQLSHVIRRLFPFKRGLTHAYWAPNFWALYNSADYLLVIILKRVYGAAVFDSVPGYATGLVQEFDHLILPTVKPLTTFIVTAATIAPACAIVSFKRTNWEGFTVLLTLCAFSSFLFGWHVHEKAILIILIPLCLLTVIDYRYAKIFLILSVAGYFSLFPLLFQPFESPIKYCAFLIYVGGSFWGLRAVYRLPAVKSEWSVNLPLLNILESLYVLAFVPLEILCTFIDHHPILSKKFTFAPLMLTSVYCSIGVVYCWLLLYWTFLCKQLDVNTRVFMKKWRKERLVLRRTLRVANDEFLEHAINGKEGSRLRLVGGLDVSTAIGDTVNAIGCLAVLSFPELKVVHSICEHVTIEQPYVAGYLAFREAPVMISLVRRLQKERPDLLPQVLFVDGNGLLHPDRFGLACHVGVNVDIPTIGAAKDLHLVDGIQRPSSDNLNRELHKAGSSIELKADDGETLGAVVRTTSTSKNPIFVSVGHRINLDTAVKLSISSSRYRVPEPIRAADAISREHVRRELL